MTGSVATELCVNLQTRVGKNLLKLANAYNKYTKQLQDCLPLTLKAACSLRSPEAERNYLLLLLLHPNLFVLEA